MVTDSVLAVLIHPHLLSVCTLSLMVCFRVFPTKPSSPSHNNKHCLLFPIADSSQGRLHLLFHLLPVPALPQLVPHPIQISFLLLLGRFCFPSLMDSHPLPSSSWRVGSTRELMSLSSSTWSFFFFLLCIIWYFITFQCSAFSILNLLNAHFAQGPLTFLSYPLPPPFPSVLQDRTPLLPTLPLTGGLWQAQHAVTLHPAVARERGLLAGSRAPHRDAVAKPRVVHQGVVFAQLHELQRPQVLWNFVLKLLLLWDQNPETVAGFQERPFCRGGRGVSNAVGTREEGTFVEPRLAWPSNTAFLVLPPDACAVGLTPITPAE